jgi:NDP-sugar pyrophosphorylase family protein
MQCVILAGGLGTRMQAVTKGLPKSLIPINGQPFLDYQLTWLAKQGIMDVVLCIGYGGDKIQDYAKDGSRWGFSIRYVNEGMPLRGTAGALRLAYDQGHLKDNFLIMYGDSFLPIDFLKVWTYFQNRKESALMTVFKNLGRYDKSNAVFDGDKVIRYDKHHPTPEMTYIDYGLNALRTSIIEKEIPPEQPADLSVLFRELSLRNDLAGLEISSRFYEVGSPKGLKDFETYLTITAP